MMHGIPPVQFTCLTVFFHNLSPSLPLGLAPSTSYTIHFFTQSLSSFHSTCSYYRNLFCCSTEIISCNPSLSFNSLLGTLSCSLTPYTHLTIFISEVPPHFPFSWARSHFRETYYFTHNCYTISLSLSMIYPYW